MEDCWKKMLLVELSPQIKFKKNNPWLPADGFMQRTASCPCVVHKGGRSLC